ncbi:hypothetical protein [Flavihumibacter petaseus]|uniref:Uncharacterized protein n=1 Tax=Flavihumibacter petaseus NBRC 106054 TaxID=1220578 RepID=A0A0E9N411_9BACT|nr:hypothetical protein [Flavihumibacter petaseus]GAO44105.1 hypothetical protein FPE01S_03_01440 [Flavihumibacter petaseus NBRC 106054]
MTDRFIMESFWQHPEAYNCAVVAVIKTAILQYGIGKIFSLRKTNKNYLVRLRNGESLNLTTLEVDQLYKGCSFVYSRYTSGNKQKDLKRLKKYVKICYAIMVKYLHEIGFRDQHFKISKAKKLLQFGFGKKHPFNTDHLYLFLGLTRNDEITDFKKKHLPYIRTAKALILYSPTHVVAVSNGYYDDYGTPTKLKNDKVPKLGKAKAEWWYELKA